MERCFLEPHPGRSPASRLLRNLPCLRYKVGAYHGTFTLTLKNGCPHRRALIRKNQCEIS